MNIANNRWPARDSAAGGNKIAGNVIPYEAGKKVVKVEITLEGRARLLCSASYANTNERTLG